MTMQVGMVGTDGILIASDTRWMNDPPLLNQTTGSRLTFSSSKIAINREKGIVATYARNMEVSRDVAIQVLELEEKEWEYPIRSIEAIGERALKSRGARKDAHCLIAFARPILRLFLFYLATTSSGEPVAVCQEMQETAFAGDNVNSAIFWSDQYYRKMPIERLVPLAAHLVLTAGKLNTATIGGLEIVLLDASGIQHLSDKSLQDLHLKSDQWSKRIGKMILAEQQFTYAPNVVG